MRFLSILILCSAAAAQQPARIAGSIHNVKGDPLRGATVKLLGIKTYSQVTDVHGAFTFDDVAPGSYALLGWRRGYYIQKLGGKTLLIEYCPYARQFSDAAPQRECYAHAPGTTLTVGAGQEVKDLTLNLAPLAVVSGTVVDQDGEPVGGWNVAPIRMLYSKGQRRPESAGFGGGRTDTEGNFSLDGLAPGRYYLMAVDQQGNLFGGMSGERPGKPQLEFDQPTFYPASPDIDHATPVDVTPGADLHGFEIHVRRSRVYAIRGKVSPPANSEVKTQILTLAAIGGLPGSEMSRTQKVNDDGTFEIRNVEPGAYELRGGRAFGNPGLPPPLFGRINITVGNADLEGVVLPLAPGVDLAGTVRMEGEKPVEWPVISLLARQDENGALIPGIDSKGAFHASYQLAPSTFTVDVGRQGPGLYVKSITYGGQDALHKPLDLSGPSASLDIVLSSNVATLSGKVTDDEGAPVTGALVRVWSRKPELAHPVQSVTTNQIGNFEVQDLGPGEYFAVALDDADPTLAEVPEFLAQFQSEAATVAVEEGAHAHVDVKLIPRPRVAAALEKFR